jgi:hypothetical protein
VHKHISACDSIFTLGSYTLRLDTDEDDSLSETIPNHLSHKEDLCLHYSQEGPPFRTLITGLAVFVLIKKRLQSHRIISDF